MHTITTRPFTEQDIPQLLALMMGLAQFEGYAEQFRVTAVDLKNHGLCRTPKFEAFVAHQPGNDKLLGMAVIYQIPWTFDLRPTVVLKELFIAPEARGLGAGRALMCSVAKRAQELDAPRVNWTVLRNNDRAKQFYTGLGAQLDDVWDAWFLDQAAINALV